jgi:hypothetical protein
VSPFRRSSTLAFVEASLSSQRKVNFSDPREPKTWKHPTFSFTKTNTAPTCATESLLDEVTVNYWRLQRARNLESQALEQDRENEKLALYARYRTAFERSFYGALNLLRKVKRKTPGS